MIQTSHLEDILRLHKKARLSYIYYHKTRTLNLKVQVDEE